MNNEFSRKILVVVIALLITGVGAHIYLHQQKSDLLPLLYRGGISDSKKTIPLRPITSTTVESLDDFIITKMNLGGNFNDTAALCSFKVQGTIADKISVPGNDTDFDDCKGNCHLDYLKIADSTGHSFFVETPPLGQPTYLSSDFTIGDKVIVRGQPSGFLCDNVFPDRTMCRDLNVTGFVAELQPIDNFDSNYAEANLPTIEKDFSTGTTSVEPAENCVTDWQKLNSGAYQVEPVSNIFH